MTSLSEPARAKLNLTLRVHGRNLDGFHEIESLAVFPELCDTLRLELGTSLDCVLEGRFASAVAGPNLVLAAAEAARALAPDLVLGRFVLSKSIPVAAGLGGGSADAAAALRLISRANPGKLDKATLYGIANALGSDIAACLDSRPVLMRGRGTVLDPVRGLPRFAVLLANPLLPLAAGEVYRVSGAAPLPEDFERPAETVDFKASFAALRAYVEERSNDLEPAARRLAPSVSAVLAGLRSLPGAVAARLSGSGPTCFALFERLQQGEEAAASLETRHPDWWIAATSVAG